MEQQVVETTDQLYNPAMATQPEIDFAELCKELRHFKKLTQQEMADRLGVSLRNYQRWEAGIGDPNAQAAFRLCQMWHEMRGKQPPTQNTNAQFEFIIERIKDLESELRDLKLEKYALGRGIAFEQLTQRLDKERAYFYKHHSLTPDREIDAILEAILTNPNPFTVDGLTDAVRSTGQKTDNDAVSVILRGAIEADLAWPVRVSGSQVFFAGRYQGSWPVEVPDEVITAVLGDKQSLDALKPPVKTTLPQIDSTSAATELKAERAINLISEMAAEEIEPNNTNVIPAAKPKRRSIQLSKDKKK